MTEEPSPYSQGGLSPVQERSWAVIAHAGSALAMVFSVGTLGFLGALAIWMVYKDRGPFVRHYASNALNIQLTALIGLVISAVLVLVLIGFVLYPLVVIVAVALHVVALLKANRGEWWKPPMTLPIFR
jgi:uncharacterized Tic20 family protein